MSTKSSRTGQGPLKSLWLLPLVLAGCGEQIDTEYGRRQGPEASRSVNGTAVLADMFADAGHTVTTRRVLSPRLHTTADTIVWFPDDFEPPTTEVCQWLDEWLMDRGGRCVVYVGRDFDAAPLYWRTVQPLAPATQTSEIGRRLQNAQMDFDSARSGRPDAQPCEWFTAYAQAAPQNIPTLSGPWAAGVDAGQAEIVLNTRLVHNYFEAEVAADGRLPPAAHDEDVLLSSQDDVIVYRHPYPVYSEWDIDPDESQLIVVNNGSFLLNMPLVNHEHRKLAGRLIDAVGPPGNVVFLESGRGGPVIRDADPTAETPSGLELFGVWPLGFVLLQLAAVGIILCCARWATFGLARDRPSPTTSDFSMHIAAMGELLASARDEAFARSRLQQYRQLVRGEGLAASGGQRPEAGSAESAPTPLPDRNILSARSASAVSSPSTQARS